MAHAEEHLRELLKLSARERAHAARRLLESLDDPSPLTEETDTESDKDPVRRLLELEGSESARSDSGSDDELAELDEIASNKEELRATVRAADQGELEPLRELTLLLQRLAELAITTGHALRAKTA